MVLQPEQTGLAMSVSSTRHCDRLVMLVDPSTANDHTLGRAREGQQPLHLLSMIFLEYTIAIRRTRTVE